MDLSSRLPDLGLKRAYESYRNPRLEDPDRDYLNTEHIEELRNLSEIVSWDEYAAPLIIPGVGTLRRVGIVTKQGYTYDTLTGIPEKPRCDVPAMGTTAWTTSLRGHNERTVRNFVRAGNYFFLVGSEGSYVTDESPEPTSPISLANSASAVLNFTHHMASELRSSGHVIDEELRMVVGESRGGMVGEGIDALAAEFAQTVIFADEVAPCLPDRMKSLRDALQFIEQMAHEPKEMYKLLGSLTLARLRYYPHTLDMRKDCLRAQVAIGGALFSGETGALARRTPGDTLKHITVFDHDFVSMRSVWEGIYEGNDQVRVTPLPGSHLTIANLETMRYVIARNKMAQERINGNLPLAPRAVFDPAHELARSQVPITAEVMNDLARSA